MASQCGTHVETVLILRADRVYSDFLRQFTLREFPQARVIITHTVEAAAPALAAEAVDLFITGMGDSVEGDVLDLLVQRAAPPSRPTRVLVTTTGSEFRVLRGLRTLGVDGVFDSGADSTEGFLRALRAIVLKGTDLAQLLPEVAALAIYAAATLALASLRLSRERA